MNTSNVSCCFTCSKWPHRPLDGSLTPCKASVPVSMKTIWLYKDIFYLQRLVCVCFLSNWMFFLVYWRFDQKEETECSVHLCKMILNIMIYIYIFIYKLHIKKYIYCNIKTSYLYISVWSSAAAVILLLISMWSDTWNEIPLYRRWSRRHRN